MLATLNATMASLLTATKSASTGPDVGSVKAPNAQQRQEIADINAVRINSVPIDIASYGAIMGSIEGPGDSGTSARDDAALQDVMTMIGTTLSHGQGGYFIAINAPGAALQTSMTPGQLQAYMQGGGAPDQGSIVSSDGHTYSIGDLLKQAFAANARTERAQALDPDLNDTRLKVAEALLDQMRADSSPPGSARSLLFGSQSAGSDTAKSIRTLVLQMNGNGNDNGVRLSIVYFPPGGSGIAQNSFGQAAATDAPMMLHLSV